MAEHYNDADLVILDSRGTMAYSYVHIPNSLPLGIDKVIKTNQYGANLVIESEPAATLFSSLGIDESKTVIIYGESLDPSASRIAWTLLYFGHVKTKILDISIGNWLKKGLPITREFAKKTATKFIPKINSSIRIEAEELYKKIESVIILDARSPQEFMASRIPNAILSPFTDGVGEDGSLFKEKGDLLRIFNEQQMPKDKELVCYCTHGHRASNLFVQLKMVGYENVKLYDGSFTD